MRVFDPACNLMATTVYFDPWSRADRRASGSLTRPVTTCAVRAVMRMKAFSLFSLRSAALVVMAGMLAVLAATPCPAAEGKTPPPLPSPAQMPQQLAPPPSNMQAPIPNKAAGSPSRPAYQITGFSLQGIRPDPVIVGSSATADFTLEAEYVDASAARAALTDLVNRLEVAVDTGSLVRGVASVDRFDFPDDGKLSQGKLRGTAIFSLSTDIRSSFFGVNWGSSHPIYLVDPASGARSSPGTVNVRSPLVAQLGLLTGGWLFVGLLGYGVVVATRILREPRLASSQPEYLPQPLPPEPGDAPRPPLPLPDVPPSLLAALSEGRAMLVVGGGASAQAGFPNGPTFLGQLVERLRDKLPPSLIESAGGVGPRMGATGEGFNKVMDAIASAVPRERVAREMQKILADVRPDRTLHNRLASLPWRGVVSLTWDTLADDVLLGGDDSWRTFALDQAGDLPAAIKSGLRVVLRPLGDLERPDTLSLSIAEFRRNLTRWPDFQRQIGLLLQTQSFLFVGVGADTLKQFLQAVGADLEVSGARHFALVPDSSENGLLSATLSRFGVVLLPYTADPRHRAVSDFVLQLAAGARAAPAPRGRARTTQYDLASSRIESVKLTNIGLFDNLDLRFQTHMPGIEQAAWTVIFGANGCGKSSILRAIGLALCGNEAAAAGGRLLQVGKNEGSIDLLFGAHLMRTRVVRNRDAVLVDSRSTTAVQAGLTLVLGFPALRGAPSDNPKGLAPLEPRGAEPADLLPLVNGEVDRRLGSFKQWLINVLEQAGRREPRAVAMKALLDDIIRDVVPGEFRKLAPLDSSYVIRVKTDDSDEPSSSDVPFDDLSQGMTSIFNWLGVLVQRLYDFYPDAAEPHKQHAVTLIDEIDAHLHPDWQRRLVELTKKFFPNVQVIATSHSPLLAGALRGKEMCVLERNRRTGRVAPLEIDVDFYGRNSQEILTSFVFGLQTDRNPETERLINRYYDLFEKVTRSDEENRELEALKTKLNNVSYGAVPEVPVAAASNQEWTAEETEILRKHFEAAGEKAAVQVRSAT